MARPAIHPGEHLLEEIEALEFWLNLQTVYDLRLAKESTVRSIKSLPKLRRPELVHAD